MGLGADIMDSLISIIVATYNNEKFIGKCLDSLVNQTYENIEVIVVNDGSTDGTGEICERYSDLYDKVRYFFKENGGVSSARNLGISKVRGDYIAFVDADDYVEHAMCEKLLKCILDNKADMACCREVVESEDNPIVANVSESEIINCSDVDMVQKLLRGGPSSCWGKLFQRDVANHLFLNIAISEDAVYITQAYCKCKKISVTKDELYHYVRHSRSALVSPFERKHLDNLIGMKKIEEIVVEKYPEMIADVYTLQYLYYIGTLARIYTWNAEKEYGREVEQIKEGIKNILGKMNYKFVPFTKKMSWNLFCLNKGLFRSLMKIYYKVTLYRTLK